MDVLEDHKSHATVLADWTGLDLADWIVEKEREKRYLSWKIAKFSTWWRTSSENVRLHTRLGSQKSTPNKVSDKHVCLVAVKPK